MGCDGGTIPRRDELVRVKQKPEQVRDSHWSSYWPDLLPFLNLPERQGCGEGVPLAPLHLDPAEPPGADRHVRHGQALLQAERH